MEYRKLGRTGLDVSVVGFGTEHVVKHSQDVVNTVVREAIDRGINYFDFFWSQPDYRDKFGEAIEGRRDKIILAGHLGVSLEDNGQYRRTRDIKESLDFFHDLLTRLRTDYVDVLMLHFVDEEEDFDRMIAPGGLLDLALKLKEEGKARFIGMSSHVVSVSLKAVQSGVIDALMFPINPALDLLPGEAHLDDLWDEAARKKAMEEATTAASGRKELYHACIERGVALVAMKPFAAGWIFDPKMLPVPPTPVQCLSYIASQAGVSTIVPGVQNMEELEADLALATAGKEEKDFSRVFTQNNWSLVGSCMYCNHCLPCPVGIDIGNTLYTLDCILDEKPVSLEEKHTSLDSAASCIECAACMERCPFGVDVISKMKQGAEL